MLFLYKPLLKVLVIFNNNKEEDINNIIEDEKILFKIIIIHKSIINFSMYCRDKTGFVDWKRRNKRAPKKIKILAFRTNYVWINSLGTCGDLNGG